MQDNKQIIERFYNAFQKLNYSLMQDCYSEYPVFNDPVFGIIEGEEVRAMWEMLCKSAKDLSLTYGNIQLLDEEYCTCNWTATYTFSRSGRKVVNHIKAHMRIQQGKITEHTDYFNFWKWARQALGISGWLLGWSNFLRRKVRINALRKLDEYMNTDAGY